ncbi:hypothetical protein [Nocardioides sp. AE5]|uniref:hypothetical protein n=1 Tax=Nocardioides sp. AE5 TaxID=2962573 RepID=UPI002880EE5C|nr:hypothetical protein [Nocardioides sp. AE5]MDT0201580.1 hypothetical protein [Nocardioides sp. AE5]
MSTFPPQPHPSQQPAAPRRNLLPWIVGGAVLVLLLIVGTLVWALSDSKPDSVQEVADRAQEAAEDLDIDKGIELLCEAPSEKDRADLDELLGQAREKAGTDDPEVTYEISKVTGEEEGSFHVEVTSDDGELEGHRMFFKVLVESKDGHSCIAGVAEAD